MSKAELEQLSRDVAEKYNIAPYITDVVNYKEYDETTLHDVEYADIWLYSDLRRCVILAIDKIIGITPGKVVVTTDFGNYGSLGYFGFQEFYSNHNYNKEQATCVAILKALLAKDKS